MDYTLLEKLSFEELNKGLKVFVSEKPLIL